ncbi:ComEC/Rec2 family competence protein [Nocardioides terrisoli]|uniref:ComEC/Rec2 family competence protein n=1 Tax=Nocardioides terrisoli TaxID=3388267 RepID=UPI00287B711B|nr:ComEC/Rec2 family competence protein [Nocardioides marmorisolisilvae]
MTPDVEAVDAPDLRLPTLAVVAWSAALAARLVPAPVLAAMGTVGFGWWAWQAIRSSSVRARCGWLVLAAAVVGVVLLRGAAVRDSPVAALSAQRATVHAALAVTSDPRTIQGRFGSRVMVRASVERVTGRGATYRVHAPVLVFGPSGHGPGADAWRQVEFGERLEVAGRLSPSDDDGLTGLLTARGPPNVLTRPGVLLRAAASVRAGVHAAVAGRSSEVRGLIPALVDGDDTAMSTALQDDFRATGLTHLLAVSGTNLTLVVGFLLVIARGLGVRARGLTAVGFLGIAGFVLLARTEPSVLRAAAMGSVALVGMGSGARARGTRAWGACVLLLMLFDPGLAISAGFALSALATAGILFLAPGWRDSLCRWMPRWLAEAIAVPTAAQLACTPLIAALSGQVSLVAVGANMAVAPVVGPATVLGLTGGVIALVAQALGALVALPAAWCGAWIIGVAKHAAALPVAAGEVSTGPVGLTVLVVLCGAVALLLGTALARRATTLGLCAVLVVAVLVPLPTPGWPPRGWVLVACDVGQGDGLVLRASVDEAVVVDTGPTAELMDHCLDGLGVRRIPLVLLTHFHADHVGGLSGVLDGRQVGAIEVSPYAVPEAGAQMVRGLAARDHVPVVTAQYGEVRSLGVLRWQVLAPSEAAPAGSDSPPNDDSVVLYVQTRGIRLLMMGDEETGSQERLHALFPALRADVLKVAHHGSAKQDPGLVRSLGAAVGLISVGADNDYGHPAPSTLKLLRSAHIRAYRTDLDGSVAVVVDHGLRVVGHR